MGPRPAAAGQMHVELAEVADYDDVRAVDSPGPPQELRPLAEQSSHQQRRPPWLRCDLHATCGVDVEGCVHHRDLVTRVGEPLAQHLYARMLAFVVRSEEGDSEPVGHGGQRYRYR